MRLYRIWSGTAAALMLYAALGCGKGNDADKKPRFALRLVADGDIAGTITSEPVGIRCGTACALTFAQGTQIKLTAQPFPEWKFIGWKEACTGADPLCTVTMDQETVVRFTFARAQVPAANVASIMPATGPIAGGTMVTIAGAGFDGKLDQGVTIGGVAATQVRVVSATQVTAVTAATTKLGAQDVVVTRQGGSNATLPQGFRYYTDTVSLDPQQSIAALKTPYRIATADVNGDGYLDVLVPQGADGNLALLLGSADGKLQTRKDIPTGATSSSSVVAADFDGDKKLDLVVGNLFPGGISYLKGNGDGTFAAPKMTTGDTFGAIALSDLDGDKKLDIIGVSGDTIIVYGGNGDGTFAMKSMMPGFESLNVAAMGDLDGDGKPDMIVGDYSGGQKHALEFIGNGDGTFKTPINLPLGAKVSSVAIADLDKDGKLDAILTMEQTGLITVLGGIGDGTFKARVDYAAGAAPYGVSIGDLNGDGALDVAWGNTNTTTVGYLLNKGDGTFANAISATVDTGPYQTVIADVNKDSRPDIISSSYTADTVSVLLGASK